MKRLHTILAVTAAALFCAAAATSSAQELVVNGGFESGDFAPGWALNDASNFSNVGNSATFALDGTRYANLGSEPGVATLSQIINTVPGQSYLFQFHLAVDATIIPGDPAPTNFFQALFDGVSVYNQSNLPGDENGGPYMPLSFNVVASGTNTTIEFRYAHNNDFFRLDGVSVVPEPSTVALLAISGIGGLAAAYRRSRRVSVPQV